MATKYAKHVSTRQTHQAQAIPGKPQVANSAGGYSFAVDNWKRLDRFLILGCEGGSYYASEQKLTAENATSIQQCANDDAARTVARVVEISEQGRAPKNDPAIFALAMLSAHPKASKMALEAMPRVCRIGTRLFQFVDAVRHFRGRGRALNSALKGWYESKPSDNLAYQLVKYQQREGWTHRDILRLCKPKGSDPAHGREYRWAVGKGIENYDGLSVIEAFEKAKRAASAGEIAGLIHEHNLPRECVPTEFLNEASVWEALLEKMPMAAMIRNLGKMSSIGLIAPMSEASRSVASRLNDKEAIVKARVHPMSTLVAMKTYQQGRGGLGSLTWNPVPQVVDALDAAFYHGFDAIEPTNKRWLLGVDVSGSMSHRISNAPLSCAEAAAALAMVTIKTEPTYYAHGSSGEFVDLNLSPKMRLDDVIRRTRGMNFGSTHCALPMVYALQNQIPVDVFVVYTDSETWCGNIHPCQALVQYRQHMGIDAKLIVCAFAANKFSIADPSDAGMLDVVGFSTDVPAVMREFACQ